MSYIIVGLLVASIIGIIAIVAYYQNKVAEVNQLNVTLQNQKKASDNDIQKYRDDAKAYAQPSRDRDDIADALDRLRE